MLKLARLGAASLLGLLMAIGLMAPGAFAQRVDTHHGSTPSAHQVVTQPVSMKIHQRAGWWGPGYWGGGWGWSGGCWDECDDW